MQVDDTVMLKPNADCSEFIDHGSCMGEIHLLLLGNKSAPYEKTGSSVFMTSGRYTVLLISSNHNTNAQM